MGLEPERQRFRSFQVLSSVVQDFLSPLQKWNVRPKEDFLCTKLLKFSTLTNNMHKLPGITPFLFCVILAASSYLRTVPRSPPGQHAGNNKQDWFRSHFTSSSRALINGSTT